MMEWSPEQRFAASADVLLSGEGELVYLTDLGSGNVFQVNATAALVFELAREGHPYHAMRAALAGRYPDVPSDEIAQDVRESLAEFVQLRLMRLA